MENIKSKVVIAATVCVALFASVWGGLSLYNRSRNSAEFVVTTDQGSDSSTEFGSTADSEVLAVVQEIESGLEEEAAAFKNPKVQMLSEIIEMGLTEDATMLDEIKNLTDEDKAALKAFYRQLEFEDRNGRGTTVYLLGQNLAGEEDLQFLEEVIKENPCLSLDDCQTTQIEIEDETVADPNLILAYPQIVAVRSLEAHMSKANGQFRSKLIDIINQAALNPNTEVQKAAKAALKGF